MVVGEAPGRTEDEGGAPFIGRSGKLFFTLLEEEVGLTRAECYVTNVVKCRPPANRTPTPLRDRDLSAVVGRTAGPGGAGVHFDLGQHGGARDLRLPVGNWPGSRPRLSFRRHSWRSDLSPGSGASRRAQRGGGHARRPRRDRTTARVDVSWRRYAASGQETQGGRRGVRRAVASRRRGAFERTTGRRQDHLYPGRRAGSRVCASASPARRSRWCANMSA